jgi:hypothetical protein
VVMPGSIERASEVKATRRTSSVWAYEVRLTAVNKKESIITQKQNLIPFFITILLSLFAV